MNKLERFVAVIAPHHCLLCNAEGDVICAACRQEIVPTPERCYKCRKATQNSLTCPICRKTSMLRHVWAVTDYDGIAKDVIKLLKFDGVRAAAEDLAAMMARLPIEPNDVLAMYVVHIPTATSRKRQRGYDQAELLAKALAKRLGLPHRPMLARVGHSRQVGAKRADRLTQLQDAFRARYGALPQNAHIILVDDVITTGATLEAAARVLKAAGARQVDAVVFAEA